MLIITRKRGQAFDLKKEGQVQACITILEFLPNNVVRIGVEAEPDIQIVRDDAMVKDNGDGDYEDSYSKR